METADEVLEVTDPEFAQFIVKSGGLQDGDWVRFSPQCYEAVGIPAYEVGVWHRVRFDRKPSVWRADPDMWVFHEVRDAKAVDGWRRELK